MKTSTGTRRLSFSSLLAVTQIEEEEEEDADIREEHHRQCLCKHFKKWKKKWKSHHQVRLYCTCWWSHGVTWRIDRSVQRQARITWGVELILAIFFHLFL